MALQLATRDGWEAFLSRHPDGFYANLAKGQLNKIAAEDARAVAAEKARFAEQERARLAEQGAREAELTKAVAAAKAAEEARIAAEETKRVAQEKVAAAETTRLAEQEKVKGVEKEKVVAAEQAGAIAEKPAIHKGEQLAALSPSSEQTQLKLQVALHVSAATRVPWTASGTRPLSARSGFLTSTLAQGLMRGPRPPTRLKRSRARPAGFVPLPAILAIAPRVAPAARSSAVRVIS